MPSADTVPTPDAAPDSRPSHLAGPWGVALGLLAFAASRLWWMGTEFLYDDAFITFRYARNLASGLGFVFNEGEWVLGTSAPAFGLMLAGLARLGLGIPFAAKALGLLAELLSLLAVRRLLAQGGWVRLWWGFVVLFALDPLSIEAGVGGMEAPLFVAVVLWATVAAAARNPLATGGLLGLATLLRPDGVLAAIALLPFAARRRGFEASEAVSAYLAVTVPFAIWGYVLYGTPIPQSVTAKLAFGAHLDGALGSLGSREALATLFSGGGWSRALTALAVVGLVEAVRRGSWIQPVAAHAALVVAGLMIMDPVFFPWYAYLARPAWLLLALLGGNRLLAGRAVPAAAWALFAGGWLAASAWEHSARLGAWSVLPFDLIAAAALTAGAALLWWLRGLPVSRRAAGLAALAVLALPTLPAVRGHLEGYVERYRAVDAEAGSWLAENGSPTVAAWEIGYLGWAYEGRVVDLVGLVSPDMSRRHAAWQGPFDQSAFLAGVEADWVVADWLPPMGSPPGAACFAAPGGAVGRCLSPPSADMPSAP